MQETASITSSTLVIEGKVYLAVFRGKSAGFGAFIYVVRIRANLHNRATHLARRERARDLHGN